LAAVFETARDRFIDFHARDKRLAADQIQLFHDPQQSALDVRKNWRSARCNLELVAGYGGQAVSIDFRMIKIDEQRIREYDTQSAEQGY
jgi:hypothetical protein